MKPKMKLHKPKMKRAKLNIPEGRFPTTRDYIARFDDLNGLKPIEYKFDSGPQPMKRWGE